MRRGELENTLDVSNSWWRTSRERSWEQDDRDLRGQNEAPFIYRPEPLADLHPRGLYLLIGPRRVGKSVEIKRAISGAIGRGVDPRHVIHADCNGWRASDLVVLQQLADDLAPQEQGNRIFFLDEITAIDDDWVARIAWLRNQTKLRDDCIVLSGSSAERLGQAQSDLADRRGPITDSTRLLLPMGFRAFCRLTGVDAPELPTVHPRDLLGREAGEHLYQLRPYLPNLTAAWERYLQIGGFPRAAQDWIDDREISDGFLTAIWDSIHGELRSGEWSSAQTQKLLELLALRLTSRVNKADILRDLGGIHHDVLDLRLQKLENALVTWLCHLNKGGRPDLASQWKLYFVDPLHARLAHLRRREIVRPPDFTQLSEQQIGVTLLKAREREAPGSWADEDTLLYYRSSTRKEVDFTGPWLGNLPIEGKYTEGAWRRETQTAVTAYGKCILATRNVLERDGNQLAVPAAFIAYLLEPEAPEARPKK